MSDDISPPPGLSLVRSEESAGASQPSSGDVWLVPDVAAYLRRSPSWVYQKTAAGKIPCTRELGGITFDADTVRAWWKALHKGRH